MMMPVKGKKSKKASDRSLNIDAFHCFIATNFSLSLAACCHAFLLLHELLTNGRRIPTATMLSPHSPSFFSRFLHGTHRADSFCCIVYRFACALAAA